MQPAARPGLGAAQGPDKERRRPHARRCHQQSHKCFPLHAGRPIPTKKACLFQQEGLDGVVVWQQQRGGEAGVRQALLLPAGEGGQGKEEGKVWGAPATRRGRSREKQQLG
jgi:hypothetical protein